MASYDIPQFPAKRLRYYNNQFLIEQDFIDDQAAHLSHERAHLRALFVAGVWEGLNVSVAAGGANITISAGIAADNLGRMIVLAAAATWPTPNGLSDGDYLLHISYNEVTSDMSSNPPAGPGGIVGPPDFTRWNSVPLIGATIASETPPRSAIVIGDFHIHSNAVTDVSITHRQYSGIRLPGNSSTTAMLTSRNESDNAQLLGKPTVTVTDHVSNWARLSSGEVRIFETGSAERVYVGLAAPGELAASYTMTWPAALPAASTSRLISIDSAGTITLTPTLPGSRSLIQIDSAGAITSSNVLAANQSVTISGTGKYKHGTVTEIVSVYNIVAASGCTVAFNPSFGEAVIAATSASPFALLGICMRVGMHISAVRVNGKISSNPLTLALKGSVGGSIPLGSLSSSSYGYQGAGTTNWTVTNEHLWVEFSSSGVGANTTFNVRWLEIDVDQP